MKPLTQLAAAFNKPALALAAIAAPLLTPAAALADSFSFSYSTAAPRTQVVHVMPQPVYTHYYPQRVVVREQIAYRPMHAGYWGHPNTVVVHHYEKGRHWHGRGHGKHWRGRGHDDD